MIGLTSAVWPDSSSVGGILRLRFAIIIDLLPPSSAARDAWPGGRVSLE